MRSKSILPVSGLKIILLFAAILLGTGFASANTFRKTLPALLPVTSGTDYETSYTWDHGQEIIQVSKSRFHQKRPVIRRKAQRLIEGEEEFAPDAKAITGKQPGQPRVVCQYEAPFFLSEQHAFLYRLTIF